MAYPLQLINEPIVALSLQLNPAKYRDARRHPPNLPTNAVIIITIVNAHVSPLFNNPRSVDSPDIVKYYQHSGRCQLKDVLPQKHDVITHQRQENNRSHILQLLCQVNRQAPFSWDDKSHEERA